MVNGFPVRRDNITESIINGLGSEEVFTIGERNPQHPRSDSIGSEYSRLEYAKKLGYFDDTSTLTSIQSEVTNLLDQYGQQCKNREFQENILGDTQQAQETYKRLVRILMCSGGVTIAPVIDWRVDRSCQESEQFLSLESGGLTSLAKKMIQTYVSPKDTGLILNKGNGSGHASWELYNNLRQAGIENTEIASVGRELFGSIENILSWIYSIEEKDYRDSPELCRFAIASVCKKMIRWYLYEKETIENQPDISKWQMKYPFFDVNQIYNILHNIKNFPEESLRHILDTEGNLKVSVMHEDDDVRELTRNERQEIQQYFALFPFPKNNQKIDLNSLVEMFFYNFCFSDFVEIPRNEVEKSVMTFSVRSDSHEGNNTFTIDMVQNAQGCVPGGIVITDGIRGSYMEELKNQERVALIGLLFSQKENYKAGILKHSKTGMQSLIVQKQPFENVPYLDFFDAQGISTGDEFLPRDYTFIKYENS